MTSARRWSEIGRRRWLLALTGTVLLIVGTSCGRGTEVSEAAAEHRPIVLIVVDALRADHLGTYGYDRPTTPHLDAWAERGRVFERAWATSPWTLPSFGSILTGHLPSAHSAGTEAGEGTDADVEVVAARNFVRLASSVPTIAEVLADEGFATGAFVANPFLDPRFGLDRGFVDYDHYETSNSDLRPATEVVDRALAWIDGTGEQPFFLLLHFFDPHLDYDAPPPFRGRFTEALAEDFELPVRGLWPIRNRVGEMPAAERDFIVAAYDEELAYVDAEIGRLLDRLEARGVLSDAVVLLTADHGEAFFEHDGFEHGHAMYEEVLRIPLILWGPQVSPGRDATPVSLIDVAPTIMAATGIDADRVAAAIAVDERRPAAMPGISLLELDDTSPPVERDIVAERVLYGPEAKTIVSWPYKAILEIDASEARLFDLSADPGEQQDLAADRPEELNELLGRLSEALAQAKALGTGAEAELDEDLLRRLRALGYIR